MSRDIHVPIYPEKSREDLCYLQTLSFCFQGCSRLDQKCVTGTWWQSRQTRSFAHMCKAACPALDHQVPLTHCCKQWQLRLPVLYGQDMTTLNIVYMYKREMTRLTAQLRLKKKLVPAAKQSN